MCTFDFASFCQVLIAIATWSQNVLVVLCLHEYLQYCIHAWFVWLHAWSCLLHSSLFWLHAWVDMTCMHENLLLDACLFFFEVLLMQWNGHFNFEAAPFDFVEVFAGKAHCSKAWIQPQDWGIFRCACVQFQTACSNMCMMTMSNACFPRKHKGFNVGSFDIEYGEACGSSRSHDFLSNPGFLHMPYMQYCTCK